MVGEIICAYSGLTLHQAVLLMAFIFAFLAFFAWIISSYGIQTKWITIGGQKRENQNIFSDQGTREELFRQINEIDNETVNNLYDIARQVARNFNLLISDNHCYFTLYEISDSIKDCIKAKIRRNNLKNTLKKTNKTEYVNQLLGIIADEYNDVRIKSRAASCRDEYPPFADVRDKVAECLNFFFDKANEIEIASCMRKIAVYDEFESRFKIKKLCEKYCAAPREKNKKYLSNLKD